MQRPDKQIYDILMIIWRWGYLHVTFLPKDNDFLINLGPVYILNPSLLFTVYIRWPIKS